MHDTVPITVPIVEECPHQTLGRYGYVCVGRHKRKESAIMAGNYCMDTRLFDRYGKLSLSKEGPDIGMWILWMNNEDVNAYNLLGKRVFNHAGAEKVRLCHQDFMAGYNAAIRR